MTKELIPINDPANENNEIDAEFITNAKKRCKEAKTQSQVNIQTQHPSNN